MQKKEPNIKKKLEKCKIILLLKFFCVFENEIIFMKYILIMSLCNRFITGI